MNVEAIQVRRGTLELANPLVLASGVQGPALSPVVKAIEFGAGGAVTKSIGETPRAGYQEPTLVEVDSGWVNAAGLPNPGAERFSEELRKIRGKGLPVIVSIFGGDAAQFGRVASVLDGNEFIAFELNLSCPHVEGVGTEVGHDPEEVAKVVKAVKRATKKPVYAKLSPNTDRVVEVAGAAVDAGSDGLTAVNTLRALSVDIEKAAPALSNVYGGLSGDAIRPVALRCVYELREKFDVPIMGCGGVSGWESAVQFLLAGADAVQIGSATMGKLTVFNEINLGIISYMERKGYKSLSEMVGRANSSRWRGGAGR